MKKLTTIWSVLLILVTMAACRKAEMPVADPQTGASLKKAGGGTTTASRTYSGQATGVHATIWNFQSPVVTSNQTVLSQTGLLPAAGGSGQASLALAGIPGALTAESLQAATLGQADSSRSDASVSNLNLTVGGNVITADLLTAKATAKCGSVLTGSARIVNLVVNGTPVAVTGAANQAIYLSNGGFILLNEKNTSSKNGTITVSALHLIVPNAADIRLATVMAGIKC